MSDSILIAGAGIGGLTLARASQLHGFKPLVLEMLGVLAPTGAGLAVQPNGIAALRHVALDKQVMRRGICLQSASIMQSNGRVISQIQMPPPKHDENDDGPMVAIRRSDLHSILLDAVDREQINLDCCVTNFEQIADRVVVRLENGDEHIGAALIGCDGIRSAVRRELMGDSQPRYSGYTSWRGLCSRKAVSVGDELHEIWGSGLRFGYTPVSRQSTYWFAVANSVAGKDDGANAKSVLLSRFSSFCQPVAAIIEATSEDQILKTDIFDRKPLRKWSHARVTLLGDAAHPMTPDLGQGACQAIEDAIVLAGRMSRTQSIIEAFSQYERARVGRTTKIVNLARRFGWMAQWENKVCCRVRNLLIRTIPAAINRRQTKKLWRFEL